MDGERRRREKKEPSSKLAAFEKLKAIKSGGKKNKCEIGPLENVYEEVSEKEYTETVLKRQEDDWIVGDYAAEGYVEDGREIFDDDLDEESIKKNQKTKKRDRIVNHKNVEPPKGHLEKMFKNMPAKRKREVKLEDDDVLGSLMQELESPSFKVAKKEISLQKPDIFSDALATRENGIRIAKDISIQKHDPFSEAVASLGNGINTVKKDISVERHDISSEAVASLESDILQEPVALAENISKEPIAVVESTCEELTTTVENMLVESVASTENMLEEPVMSSENLSEEPAVSAENCKKFQKFFYWDAYEDPYNQPGTVFLFGKIWVETTKTYASCCVMVKNIYRKVYLLPREKIVNFRKKQKERDVKIIDVYNEFNEKVADKLNIMKFKSRKMTKHYAFNIPDIPDTCEYLEVQYPATDPALPADLTGETFSQVFGVNTGYLEIFLLDRKIKGPSWLAISEPNPAKLNFSWCKFEFVCDDMSNITVINDGGPPPPLVVMSLNIRITPLPTSHENQITMIGWLVHNEYHTDRPAPSPQFKDHFCAFTKPTEVMFPVDAKSSKEELAKHSSTNIEKLSSERALLAIFLAKFHKIDPDLIVGHDIYGFDISTLVYRIVTNKIPHWSRLGRLKRQEAPKAFKGKNYVERNLICGRLLCDIKISAKELIRARSYDLSSLCELVLHMKEGERKEVKAEVIKDMYSSSDLLIGLIKLTMSDALYILRIMYDLNAIPLSLQITNIAGNVMSRTLMGGRSERNEYLLLHAFHEKNYIVPDKVVYGKNAAKDEATENGTKGKGKRKPQYEGGLVLDPKAGFYDKLILLMDFNSLYPSIIQEYNICFTTISVRAIQMENEDDVLKLMKYLPSDAEPGILPTEIKKLVESRRQVKALMKRPDMSSDLRHQYDIRQLALKLTANSMYGCLGFSNSRFYAKPLAAMITAKGREILLNTRDLVHRLNYDVIYGDTDSLMINTNVVDYDEVFNIGKRIKVEVNKLYKQIELDIDGVFKYMLLLKKKKYAALTVTKVNGKLIMKQEIKGLDVVRRDWSQLSAEAGKFVLHQILSDQSLDDKLGNIHSHLEKLKTDLAEQRVPISLLAITKQLTKNPEEYPDKKSLPHVQVALRMNLTRNKKFRQGDTIAYVICQDGTSNVALQRAYHVDEFKTKDNLTVDVNYYLSQQIHPVVSRLCELIDGIDAILIAESLGLDIAAYQKEIRTLDVVIDGDEISTDKSQVFKNCDSFQFKCPNEACGTVNSMDAPCIRNDDGNLEFVLSRCANKSCRLPPYEYLPRLQNKLWLLMQNYVHKYYQHWLICEERTCAYRTRNIVKFTKKFEIECFQCGRNYLVQEYSESKLYTQLCFFQYIFDHTLFMSQYKELKLDAKSPVAMAYSKLKDSVDIMLMWNAYNAVSLGKLNKLMAMK